MEQRGTTKSLGKKQINDKFYTKEEVAKELIKEVDKIYNLNSFDLIVEPAAGSGSFSNNIDSCIAYDIEPENKDIIRADWLKLDKEQFKNKGKVLIIGNPPFGTNCNLAIKFINESAKFAEAVAFILPLTFKKETLQDKVDLNFKIKEEIDIAENSFLLGGKEYIVPTIFQIWERTKTKREIKKKKYKSKYFEFVNKEDADFRIQRVGGNAGKIDKNFGISSASNYFIKVNENEISKEKFKEVIENTNFPTIEYTVGPKSLSKNELIREFEKGLL